MEKNITRIALNNCIGIEIYAGFLNSCRFCGGRVIRNLEKKAVFKWIHRLSFHQINSSLV